MACLLIAQIMSTDLQWLCFMQVAKHYYNERYGHDDTRPFHLLHAALDMGCPIGIINHILSVSSESIHVSSESIPTRANL